jgi:hypothetical protein
MNKKFLGGIAAALLIAGAIVIIINVNLAKIDSFSSLLRLANIEALSVEDDPDPVICGTQISTNYLEIDAMWVSKTETLACKKAGTSQYCSKGVRSYTCNGNYDASSPSGASWLLNSTTVHEYTCASVSL